MEEKKIVKKKRKRRGKGILIFVILLLIAGLAAFYFWKQKQAEAASANTQSVQTATAVRMDISSELTASSSLSPKDTYEVTSLVEGEVLEAFFEEGDEVEKGQVLYIIDASSMDSDLSSAETSLVRAKENLVTAEEEYNEAAAEVSGNIYKSTSSGYIKTLHLTEGDKVGNGTKIADIYDDSIMKLVVPFLSAEADLIEVGSTAVLTLEDTGEQLEGTVTIVSSLEEALSGGRLVKSVTIEAANPGGLTTSMETSATVGEFVCASEGTFAAKTETTMSAELSGNNNLEIEELLVTEGAYVEAGTPIFKATSKSAEKYLKSFKDSVETASDNVTSAENKLTNTQDSIDEYTITAPISGTVITKNSKVGDKITKGTSGSTTMAVIYDLSAMTISMSVDELDVGSVKVGQTVELTADAVEGETFTGTVTNVSLESSYSSGVTNYPVTVTIEETGSLLPGMNVDARIILDSAENAICIPVGALQRGNRVYVKQSTTEETSAESETAGAESAAESGRPDDASGTAESGAGEGNHRGGPNSADGEAESGASKGNHQGGPNSADGEAESGADEGGHRGEFGGADGEAESGAGEGGHRGGPDSAAESDPSESADGSGESESGVESVTESSRASRKTESTTAAAAAETGTHTTAASQSNVPEGFVAVVVETGIINDDYVEILSGLSAGDEVYVSESSGTTTVQMQMGGMGQMGGGSMGGGNMGGSNGGGGQRNGGSGGGRP